MESPDISGFIQKGKVSALYDGQFGSTGKGLAAAWVGEHNEIDWCVTNASANAGHTSIIDNETYILFHLPSSFLTASEHSYSKILINKGAIVDLDVLCQEIEDNNIRFDQIYVDPNAAIILPEDKEAENQRWASQTKIASTQKGCGAALARKVERQGPNLGQYIEKNRLKVPFSLKPVSLNRELSEGKSVLLEIPQGFSLSLSASGFYPHTTSRDCTLQQGLSDAGIHPSFFYKSMAVIRMHPIRVGNIVKDGIQIGFSGRGYPDQREITWESLGLEPEVTTVTKRQRRVFTFSLQQYEQMVEYSRPDIVFLNFANYSTGPRVRELDESIRAIHRRLGMAQPVMYYGYGAKAEEISEYIK